MFEQSILNQKEENHAVDALEAARCVGLFKDGLDMWHYNWKGADIVTGNDYMKIEKWKKVMDEMENMK